MTTTIKHTALRILLFCVAAGLTMTASAVRQDCWMTGGGSVFNIENGLEVEYDGRATHGFIVHCDTRNPNNLQVNWGGNRFHLRDLTSAACPDTPGIEPNPPDASFDTFIGMGYGRYNGEPGAFISFTFTDAGEPGVADTAEIAIWDAAGNQVLAVSGDLMYGNHQAHSK